MQYLKKRALVPGIAKEIFSVSSEKKKREMQTCGFKVAFIFTAVGLLFHERLQVLGDLI